MPASRSIRRASLLVALLTVTLMLSSCDDDDDDTVIIVDTGVVAGDFQSLADYFSDPVVQTLLDNMSVAAGDDPPDVTGTYESNGVVTIASDPALVGLDVFADFCAGPAARAELEFVVLDPTVVDDGARSFIEGNGDSFTIYTAFKSVQTVSSGRTCEIHEVNVFAGTLLADGSIADLTIGLAIVGLIGDCRGLFVGDIQISENTADRVGDGCDTSSPDGPENPDAVLVEIENDLVVDVLVFLGDALEPVAEVPARSIGVFETLPGFNVEFETLRPIAGQDLDGSDLFMGEIVCGAFPEDVTPAGGTVAYIIENRVGSDEFFAPLPTNNTALEVFSVVNSGVLIADCSGEERDGWDCFCAIPPSLDAVIVGYYTHSAPGIIDPAQSNVQFFNVANENQLVDSFLGPFVLDEFSGTLPLLVEDRR